MIVPSSPLSRPSRTPSPGEESWPERLRRVGMMSGGSVCVLLGFVFALIPPIPLGVPLLAIGTAMLMRSSEPLKRWMLVRTRRVRRMHRFVRRMAGKV